MSSAVAIAPREERVPVRNGLQFFIRSWNPGAARRAVVGIVHGVKSHSGYYHWAAADAPHGIMDTHTDRLNANLLAFVGARAAKRATA